MLIFIKNTIKIAFNCAFFAFIFSSCLKKETIELNANPLQVVNDDTKITLFKLDSVVMTPTFAGYRDVAIYYTNSYKTLPAEVQKRIDGVALKNGQTEKIINLNQRIYGFPEQLVGSVLNISFSFTINEQKERTRLTTFQIPVQ